MSAWGFAVVENDRLIARNGKLQLFAQTPLLHVARGKVVVIVEADFAEGDAAVG